MFRHRIDHFISLVTVYLLQRLLLPAVIQNIYSFEGHRVSCYNLSVFHHSFSFESTFFSPKVHDVYIILKQNFMESLFLKFSKQKNKSLKSYKLFKGGR